MTESIQQVRQAMSLAAAFLAAISLTGCDLQSTAVGTADRSFPVSGPVRLEVTTGSGDCRVLSGPAGRVSIHAQFRVHAWPWENAQRRLSEVESNFPVSQEGNFVRVGGRWSLENVSADYTLIVPADSEMRSLSGSGNTEVDGISGPASFVVGSGDISATHIGKDVRALSGSGHITVTDLQGQLDVTSGSGNVQIVRPQGDVRLHTASGDIRIESPGSDVEAITASGDIVVTDAIAGLHLRTRSGDITVNGNPGPEIDWDIRASSGDVKLEVRSSASFRFYARSSSGDIHFGIPVIMEGDAGKHEVRARIGDGKGRVEVQTSSGDISVR